MISIPTIDMAATGRNIARLRRLSGLSIRKLQGILGFSTPQAIYKWQRGDSLPTLDNMVVLSAAFGVSIEEILVVRERLHALTVLLKSPKWYG